jgi:MFS family permease
MTSRQEETARRRGWGALLLDIVAVLVLPGAITAAVYLAPFADDPTTMPFGRDTAGYIWRTSVVHDLGVDALTRRATSNPKSHGERPAHPVVLSIVRSITGQDSLTVTWIAPALFASAIALAIASFVVSAIREPGRLVGAAGIAVGGSAFVAWTAVGYATNLAFDVVAVAAAAVAARAAFGGRGRLALFALIGGGALIHWAFAVAISILLVAWALLLCLWREIVRRRNPAARGVPRSTGWLLVASLVGATALGGIVLFTFAPELPRRAPNTPREADARIEERLPDMALPLTVPLAVAGFGVVALTDGKDPLRRWSAGFLLVWASLAVAGLVAWYSPALPAPPPYRTAAFALGIPALIAIGALAGRRWLAGTARLAGEIVGIAVVAAAPIWLVGAGARVWWNQPSPITAEERGQLATLSSYLEHVPEDSKIVIPVPPRRGSAPKSRAISGLPPARIPYVDMPKADIDPSASDLGLGMGRLDPRTTVVAVLDVYFHGQPPTGRPIGPGVWILVGPEPGDVTPGTAARAPHGAVLGALWAAALAMLMVAGFGWSRGLTGLPALSALGLAPAFGLAILGTFGTIGSRIGVPLHGSGAFAILAVTTASGWVTVLVARRARGRHAEGLPD